MSRTNRLYALAILLVAVLFFFFFDATKHNPALSQVNPFADDPYDAVGSFGVQLALLTALLSLVRAFRPYPSDVASDSRQALLIRGEYVSCLSVAVTLAADGVAMIRHPSLWVGSAAGLGLAGLIAGMAGAVALVGWRVYRAAPHPLAPPSRKVWMNAIAAGAVGLLILAFYPEAWRASVPGAIGTVLVGAATLFVPVRAFGLALSPLDSDSVS
ncbi:MAG: hypothetical protein WCF84_04045, partial [Anaerolineae bacterium]